VLLIVSENTLVASRAAMSAARGSPRRRGISRAAASWPEVTMSDVVRDAVAKQMSAAKRNLKLDEDLLKDWRHELGTQCQRSIYVDAMTDGPDGEAIAKCVHKFHMFNVLVTRHHEKNTHPLSIGQVRKFMNEDGSKRQRCRRHYGGMVRT
jgi:hypothetical protein